MNIRIGWILIAVGAVLLATKGGFFGIILLAAGGYVVWKYPSQSRRGPNRSSPSDWPERRRAVWERDKRQCRVCLKLLKLSTCDIHHITPRSKGGNHEIGNLLLLCKPCHAKMPNHQHLKRRWMYREHCDD